MPITIGGFTILLADRVKETTQTTGSGSYTLDGAATGFRTFVAGIGNGNRTTYTAVLGANWETGIGTVTAGAPATLSRDDVLASSNANNAVSWGAGVKDIFCDVAAAAVEALQANFEATAVNRAKTTTFTASGTFTTDADCMFAMVRIVGGGGAGGGTPATNAFSSAEGGGGGGGEYAEGWFTAVQLGASQTVTIGAGGTGVSNGTGNTGGTTSFGALMTAIGGAGGAAGAASNGDSGTFGGMGGTGGTGGSFRVRGGSGTMGLTRKYSIWPGPTDSGIRAQQGLGGSSVFGHPLHNPETPAIGQLYGSGGNGSSEAASQGAQAGGAGAAGICIVVEFCRI